LAGESVLENPRAIIRTLRRFLCFIAFFAPISGIPPQGGILLRKAPNPSPEVAGRQNACLAAVFLSLLGTLLFAAQASGAAALGDALASASTTGTQAVTSVAQPVRAATADVEGATAPATRTIQQTSSSAPSTAAKATSTTSTGQVASATAGAGEVVRQVGSTTASAGEVVRQVGWTTASTGQVVRQVGSTTTSAGQIVRQVGATTASAGGQVVRQLGATTSSAGQVVRQLGATTSSAGQVVRQLGSDSGSAGETVGRLVAGAGLVTQASSAVTGKLGMSPAGIDILERPGATGSGAPVDNGPRASRPSPQPSGTSPWDPQSRALAAPGDPRFGAAPPSPYAAPAGAAAGFDPNSARWRCAGHGICAGALTSAGFSPLSMLNADVPAAALALDRSLASPELAAAARERAPSPLPPPEPAATPGGVPLAGAGSGFSVAFLLALAGLLLLGAPPTIRRLRLSGDTWSRAPFLLILERPD
jgi:hypothetical protein